MATHPFVNANAKKRIKQAVEAVEACSASEVVVSVRPWSATYRHVDLAAGALLAFACLAFMLYVEQWAFPLYQFLVGTAVCFCIGTLASALATPIKRLLVTPGTREQATGLAARARFCDLGVSRTRDRSGLLIYVSLFEARCAVVPDIGIQDQVPAETWTALKQDIEEAVRRRGVGPAGVAALAVAIENLATPLAKALPRRADDVNELDDFVED